MKPTAIRTVGQSHRDEIVVDYTLDDGRHVHVVRRMSPVACWLTDEGQTLQRAPTGPEEGHVLANDAHVDVRTGEITYEVDTDLDHGPQISHFVAVLARLPQRSTPCDSH